MSGDDRRHKRKTREATQRGIPVSRRVVEAQKKTPAPFEGRRSPKTRKIFD